MHSHCQGRQDADFLAALGLPLATPANTPTKGLSEFVAIRYAKSMSFLYLPTMAEWTPQAVDAHVPRSEWPIDANANQVNPSQWLWWTQGAGAVTQKDWLPGYPQFVDDMTVIDGHLMPQEHARILNTWNPIPVPKLRNGITSAQPWLDLWIKLYPLTYLHAVRTFAFVLQHPGVKVQHGIQLSGPSGIGKDTLLKVLAMLCGRGNWQQCTPSMIMSDFNEWARTLFLLLNELDSVKAEDRYGLYDRSKIYLASPPDVLPYNVKRATLQAIMNVLLLIATSNHLDTPLRMAGDDRRWYVMWTDVKRTDFAPDFHRKFHEWLDAGGSEAVMQYLLTLDVSDYDPNALPPMTDAKASVQASSADMMVGRMADLLDAMGRPLALSVGQLEHGSNTHRIGFDNGETFKATRYRRVYFGWLRENDYVPISNPARADGYFIVNGRRQQYFASTKDHDMALSYIEVAIALGGGEVG